MNRIVYTTLMILSLGLCRVSWVRDVARRLVHRGVAGLLLLRSQPLPRSGVRRCVVIAPHPDDETLGCGGVILHRLATGANVSIVLLTDGSGPATHHPIDLDLVHRRHAEFRRATGILGVAPADLHFLNLKDGTLGSLGPAERASPARRLAEICDSLAADEIFVTSRDDGSSEHEGAFRLVADALARSTRKPVLREYPVWSWWNPLLLLRPLLRAPRVWRCDLGTAVSRKKSALAAYASQIEASAPGQPPALSPLFVRLCSSPREYFFERP
jgi:LmbE family N-acetylglucosaminyl deacetylase